MVLKWFLITEMVTCPDCFSEEHVGHMRRHLKEVYRERKLKILSALETFDKQNQEVKTADDKLNKEIKSIESDYASKKHSLREYTIQLEKAIEHQFF